VLEVQGRREDGVSEHSSTSERSVKLWLGPNKMCFPTRRCFFVSFVLRKNILTELGMNLTDYSKLFNSSSQNILGKRKD
jgi:hypothetical protein